MDSDYKCMTGEEKGRELMLAALGNTTPALLQAAAAGTTTRIISTKRENAIK